jgi:hypothetical protein
VTLAPSVLEPYDRLPQGCGSFGASMPGEASCAAGVTCRSGVPRRAGWRQPGDRHDVTSWRSGPSRCHIVAVAAPSPVPLDRGGRDRRGRRGGRGARGAAARPALHSPAGSSLQKCHTHAASMSYEPAGRGRGRGHQRSQESVWSARTPGAKPSPAPLPGQTPAGPSRTPAGRLPDPPGRLPDACRNPWIRDSTALRTGSGVHRVPTGPAHSKP